MSKIHCDNFGIFISYKNWELTFNSTSRTSKFLSFLLSALGVSHIYNVQKWNVIGRRGEWGVSKCSGHPIFIFFLLRKLDLRHDQKSYWAKHWYILLTRNLPFDSDVRQRSHSLMVALHCLWAKSNNRTRS